MAKRTKYPDEIKLKRRNEISKLLLKGNKLTEIQEILPTKGIINPHTQKPYTLSMLSVDLKELTAQWAEQSYDNIAACKRRVWAEIQAVKKEAWKEKQLDVVLKAIKSERELLGLDEIVKGGIDVAELKQIIYVRNDEVNVNFKKEK